MVITSGWEADTPLLEGAARLRVELDVAELCTLDCCVDILVLEAELVLSAGCDDARVPKKDAIED